NEERFRLALDVSGDVTWERDIQNSRMYWGKGIETVLKFKGIHETDFRWWMARVHPEDREGTFKAIQDAMHAGRDYVTKEYRFLRGDGSIANVIARVFYEYDRNRRPIKSMGTLIDVTYLRQAIQARDEMVGIVSHELKNPLTAIGTGIDLLTQTVPV